MAKEPFILEELQKTEPIVFRVTKAKKNGIRSIGQARGLGISSFICKAGNNELKKQRNRSIKEQKMATD